MLVRHTRKCRRSHTALSDLAALHRSLWPWMTLAPPHYVSPVEGYLHYLGKTSLTSGTLVLPWGHLCTWRITSVVWRDTSIIWVDMCYLGYSYMNCEKHALSVICVHFGDLMKHMLPQGKFLLSAGTSVNLRTPALLWVHLSYLIGYLFYLGGTTYITWRYTLPGFTPV